MMDAHFFFGPNLIKCPPIGPFRKFSAGHLVFLSGLQTELQKTQITTFGKKPDNINICPEIRTTRPLSRVLLTPSRVLRKRRLQATAGAPPLQPCPHCLLYQNIPASLSSLPPPHQHKLRQGYYNHLYFTSGFTSSP